jgi:DNA polymerase III alpha subunit
MLFAETFAELQKKSGLVAVERIVFIKGKIDRRRETPSIIVHDIIPIEEAAGKLTRNVLVKLNEGQHKPEVLVEVAPVLKKHKGNTRVFAQVPTNGGQCATLMLSSDWHVRPSETLRQDLEQVLGSGQVELLGDGSRRRRQAIQQKLFSEAETAETQVEVAAGVSEMMEVGAEE